MTTQLDSSIGFKKETAFGTPVTPDRFLEFTEESIDFDRGTYQGAANRVGSRVARSARSVLVKDGAKGDISLEVPTKGLGALLELILGVASHTAVPSKTGVYQQLFTLIKNDYLPSATFQKGIPRLGANTVDTYTADGMVCSSFELSLSSADVLKLKTSWLGRSLERDVTYATPSYPSASELFSFVGAAITVGGSVTLPTATALATGGNAVANIRDFSVSFDNGLDGNGFNLGGAGKRTRKPAVGVAEGKGKVTAEYDSIAFRDAVADRTELALVITFAAATPIITGEYPTVQIVLPCIRFEGAMPAASSGDVITQSLDFIVYDNLVAASPLYVVTRTADTAL